MIHGQPLIQKSKHVAINYTARYSQTYLGGAPALLTPIYTSQQNMQTGLVSTAYASCRRRCVSGYGVGVLWCASGVVATGEALVNVICKSDRVSPRPASHYSQPHRQERQSKRPWSLTQCSICTVHLAACCSYKAKERIHTKCGVGNAVAY